MTPPHPLPASSECHSAADLIAPAPACRSATATATASSTADAYGSSSLPPVVVAGKFLFADDAKFWVRGVTYGAFKPDSEGREYHDLTRIDRDFAMMAAHGINTVRIPHTTPPRHLLDVAARHGLRVMVGLSAEQHVGHLIDRGSVRGLEATIRERVRACFRHPAVLCYAIGNEIPASIVRWLGRRRTSRYIASIYQIIKEEDPRALVTYVNYPTTEYLELPFLDIVSFNVYLERQDQFRAYIARLQNVSGERPLLMTELGLDSLRNGRAAQAKALAWQLRATAEAGSVGAIVFAWTDEWFRGGDPVEDWAFGLTDRERRPKPALNSVHRFFCEAHPPRRAQVPRVSVVVCTFNGAGTLRQCLNGLMRLNYPDYEVIVVNDGSSDETGAVAATYPVRLITTANVGLSAARNIGAGAASGDIVAYIDDDAWPDPDWLSYLAAAFNDPRVGAAGGPTPPPNDGHLIQESISLAPGGATHVLLTDTEAEHVPGCSMAVRKTALFAIGSFDPVFRTAGDDVDLCWRLLDAKWVIAFAPGAQVWHRRRSTVGAYWRQQVHYGRADALLEKKWPSRFTPSGHPFWSGQIYDPGRAWIGTLRPRVYHGVWGAAPFQRLHEGPIRSWLGIALLPEWSVVVVTLGAASLLGLLWQPLLAALPLLAGALAMSIVQAILGARDALRRRPPPRRWTAWGRTRIAVLVAALQLLQPVARLFGRLTGGLTPWRRGAPYGLSWPRARRLAVWTDRWAASEAHLAWLERALREGGAVVTHGGAYDRWDLGVRGGTAGGARLLMAIEDHGSGYQYVRVGWWPYLRPAAVIAPLALAALTGAAVVDGAWSVATILGLATSAALACVLHTTAGAQAALEHVVDRLRERLVGDKAT